MDWDTLCYEEPALAEIADRAGNCRRRYPERVLEYERSKETACGLVGWGARNPRLETSAAWECFSRYIAKILRV